MSDLSETGHQISGLTLADAPSEPYRVLARKYRPKTFNELIGQDALVRTLSNALRSGRIAHAFILTGVRGVGKTTTARIVARALNCIGVDGDGGPTTEPCGVCEHCTAIAQDRHVDVLEMDAASRTGVDDVRELIDGVRYRPVSARFKVFIIDEVHMLSRNAFNALLKTLEEPPEHVKFIFATTEIRKVPVTVLSRCQRFDLRRVGAETLVSHFERIARNEGAEVEPEALGLIARAADGSVRDGLSILDQAIAHAEGTVTAVQVREMLGWADRIRIFDLFESLMRGDIAAALDQFGDLYASGADPATVVQDLLELTHWLTRLRIVATGPNEATMPEAERVRGAELAERLSMPVLSRAWQMLLKGLSEVQHAPAPDRAAEMLFVRIAYAAELPTPAEALARPEEHGRAGGAPAPGERSETASTVRSALSRPEPGGDGAAPVGRARLQSVGSAMRQAEEIPSPATPPEAQAPTRVEPAGTLPQSFVEVVDLFRQRGELILYGHLRNHVHLVAFRPGRIEFRPDAAAPTNLASELMSKLASWTGERWIATVSAQPGEPTLAERDQLAEARLREEASRHPLVIAALETFPGARIEAVREIGQTPTASGIADADDDYGDGSDAIFAEPEDEDER